MRWGLRGLLLFVILAGAFFVWVWAACFAEPPELPGDLAILQEELVLSEDGRLHFGESWFHERPGHSLLYVEGDPYSLGYANARLTSDWIYLQEMSLQDTVHGFLPSGLQFWGVTLLVLLNNRNLPDYVPTELQLEIRGIADGSEDPLPQFGPRYHRLLNYHAAHDISHWVWDKPVIGCSAFAAQGEWTTDGHLIIGRNFDFEAGPLFDENKIIGLYRPRVGQAFLSVAWSGMAGAVTGINDQKIFCSINGAHSADRGRIGTPSSLVVREVLQHSKTLDEAIEIIRKAEVFVADSYLLADGETGEAVVVEKTPARSGVRRMVDGLLLQSNHFETEELAKDVGNLEYMSVGTSPARYARLKEITEDARGALDPLRAVEILRDRRAAGGGQLSAGNRGAINAMIATHSVVADVTKGVLWVSRGPHQLGEYDPYSIEHFGEPGDSIPADPALADGTYERLVQGRKLLIEAEGLLEQDAPDGDAARLSAQRVLEHIPADPDALSVLARAYEAMGEPDKALESYRRTLAARPPFPQERAAVESAIARLTRESSTEN